MTHIRVKLCDLREPLPAEQRRAYRAMLTAQELARCERLPATQLDQALITRALLRSELAQVTGLSADALAFGHGPAGKPYLQQNPALPFNLSHTTRWVALAYVAGPPAANGFAVGLDIEHAGRVHLSIDRLARRFFTPQEQAVLQTLHGAARQLLFFRLWTLKEAWVKAHGLALAPELSRLDFAPVDGHFAVHYAGARAVGKSVSWRVRDEVTLALCQLPGDSPDLDVRMELGLPLQHWQPLQGWDPMRAEPARQTRPGQRARR